MLTKGEQVFVESDDDRLVMLKELVSKADVGILVGENPNGHLKGL